MQNINILHHVFVRGNLLCKKLIVQTKEEDKQNDQRKDISDVSVHPFLDLQAFSGVGFFCEVFPAPSTFGNAEKQIHKRTKWKQKVTYQEILEVENCTAEYLESAPAPYVVTENAWQGKKDDGNGIYKTGFFSVPAGKLHTTGNNIFKYSQDGGKCRK